MRTRWLSAIVVLACLSTAEGGDKEVSVTVGPNVQVSQQRADIPHTEVILAADPSDANRLLAGSMLRYESAGGHHCVGYLSTDGGKSWKLVLEPARSKPPLEHYGADPAVAFGRNGAAYFGLLVGAKPTDIARSMVLRSSDGGMA